MKIAVIADKPSALRAWTQTCCDVFPEIDLSGSIGLVLHPYRELNFALPRRLRASDFPYSGPPIHRPIDLHGSSTHQVLNGEVRRMDRVWDFVSGDAIELAPGEVLSRLQSADLFVDGMDAWPSSQVVFAVVLNQVFPDKVPLHKIAAPLLSSYSIESMIEGLAAANRQRGLSQMASAIAYGHSKQRFRFGFIVNANAILRPLQRVAGCVEDAPTLSPYSLQLLYALRNAGPLSDTEVNSLMYCWTGTGRYPRLRDGGIRMTTFGSPASRHLIVANLERARLLSREPVSGKADHLAISAMGERLLSLLHPDCEDPDLSFRLDEWFRLPEAEAQPKIDRYLKAFFGKQMRFQGGLSPAASELA